MRLLFINGSPHAKGATNRALTEIKKIVEKAGIEVEVIWLGNKALAGCIGCGYCAKNKACFQADIVNEIGQKLDLYAGIVVGSPVHYASASGLITCFLDRLFYAYGKKLSGKVFAALATARRAGTTATLDQLYKYGYISGMVMVGSQYWNLIHGNNETEVEHDLEGLQTMRTLGNNLVWLLKVIAAGKEKGITYPEREKLERTNFIR